ncbi:SsgA family sporulation/cell division regulator [Frankia sp. Mgl5]|nr:SsgA family sporulation/cell division regulator [Frankia sp. Mgl5]
MSRRPIVSDAVTWEFNATYLAENGERVPLPTSLRYDPADPIAITMSMWVTDQKAVVWTFARRLFVDGARRCAGLGDVRVRPIVRDRRRVLLIELSSPGGHAMIELPADRVSDFVCHTYDLLPASAEDAVVERDLELRVLRGRSRS